MNVPSARIDAGRGKRRRRYARDRIGATHVLASLVAAAACQPIDTPSAMFDGCGAGSAASRLVFLETRRTDPDGWLLEQVTSRDPTLRARAALALGRMVHADAEAALIKTLADPVAFVRATAAFALQILSLDQARDRAAQPQGRLTPVLQALRRALAAEHDDEAASAMLRALGWLGQAIDEPRIAAHYDHAHRAEAALEGLGLLARCGQIDGHKVPWLAAPLRSQNIRLRRLALWVMLRLSRSAAAKGLHRDSMFWTSRWPLRLDQVHALELNSEPSAFCWPEKLQQTLRELATADADPEVRGLALRTLGTCGGQSQLRWLVRRAWDHSPHVQAEALRQLGSSAAGALRLSGILAELWSSLTTNAVRLTGPQLNPLLVGLWALGKQAQLPPISWFANQMLELSDTSAPVLVYAPAVKHSLDLIHCAAARLWDLGVGRLDRTPTCGTAHAPQLTAELRRLVVLHTIMALQRPAEWKALALRRYLHDEHVEVRRVATASVQQLGPAVAVAALRRALRDVDLAVFGSAATVVVQQPGWFTTLDVPRLLKERFEQLDLPRDAAAACTIVDALAALHDVQALPFLGRRQRMVGLTLRQCTQDAVFRLTGHVEDHSYTEPSPLTEFRPLKGRPVPRHVVLQTSKGQVVLELFGQVAPLNVAAFLSLANLGHYDGVHLQIHPGATQVHFQRGSLPAPTWIPSELGPHPFERGTVGMSAWQADTADGSFFIALSRQPELDGRVTPFARVVAGIEVLERLYTGDVLRSVTWH